MVIDVLVVEMWQSVTELIIYPVVMMEAFLLIMKITTYLTMVIIIS